MPLLRCEPGSLKEALLFLAGSMLLGLSYVWFVSYHSVPPAHRNLAQLRRGLGMAAAVVVAVSLIGTVAFTIAQSWRRKQDLLYPRTLRPWLALALGVSYPFAFAAIASLLTWAFRIEDVTLVAWAVGLGLPVGLSRLAWRSEEPPSLPLAP